MENTKTFSQKRLIYAPMQDTFCKYGDKFEKIAHNEANGMYCYKRTPLDRNKPIYYEVFKALKARDRNGNTYDRYPNSSKFGFGVALCIRGDSGHTTDKIAFYMANGFDAGRYKPQG